MKFYDAVTVAPVTLRKVDGPEQYREFPPGTKVSAVHNHTESYNLNAVDVDGIRWNTYEGNVRASDIQLGEVIATCNEGA